MTEASGFQIDGRDGDARAGRLQTPHGEVSTPAFMSVATYGAVRGLSAEDLRDLGAEIALANTYHLHERPGEERIAQLGGLHGFTGWRGPWLTDSGGFQVTSLASRVKVSESGVVFQSPLDGKHRELTPERVISIQESLGSDIAMVLDHCLPISGRDGAPPPAAAMREAMDRTLRWAERSKQARRRTEQAVFGIVQGGSDHGMRRESAEATVAIGFDGYAHGGLGLGEDLSLRAELLDAANLALPASKPRYLMGLGRPNDLLRAVARGIDLFDCVVPTRHGRHGILFTSEGRLSIKAARYADQDVPPDANCECPTCRHHSRAYLRHLFRVRDMLGARLATLHNLAYYLRLMREMRVAILEGRFEVFYRDRLALEEAELAEAAGASSAAQIPAT
jgi:queuine tRNA-ribosyltransferase